MYYLGLDVGTSTICSVIADTNTNWKIIDIVTMPNDAKIQSNYSWENIQDPKRIMEIVEEILSIMLERYPNIYCIGISCQMHGILYIDSLGNAISPLYTWLDQRAAQLIDDRKISYGEELSIIIDRECPTGYGLATHYFNLKTKNIPKNVKSFCSIGDYVAMHLANNKTVKSDITLADSYGAINQKDRIYSKTILENNELMPELLPELIPSESIIGEYKNIPVVTAVGDNQCSFMGSIKKLNSDATISLGTSGQFTSYIDEYKAIKGVEIRLFPQKGYILSGASLCGGYSYSILRDFFKELLDWFGISNDINIYKKMDEISPLNYNNLMDFNPLFLGTRENSRLTASINNITLSNFTPQNLVASIDAGIVNELYDFYNIFAEEDKKRIKRIYGTGSFFNKSPCIKKYCEDKFKIPVYSTSRNEECAFGAIINSSVAMNKFFDYSTAIDKINLEN